MHAFRLNPVEAILGFMKRTALPCYQFDRLEDQPTAIDHTLIHRNPRTATVPKVEELI